MRLLLSSQERKDGNRTKGAPPANSTTHKFAGKERDAESGLDNFGARYSSSSIGRFTSPDSHGFSQSTDPQSWNLYAYVSNNPLIFVDPTGHSPQLMYGGSAESSPATSDEFVGDNRYCSLCEAEVEGVHGLWAMQEGVALAQAAQVPASTVEDIESGVRDSHKPNGKDKSKGQDPDGNHHEEGGRWGTKDGKYVDLRSKPGPYFEIDPTGKNFPEITYNDVHPDLNVGVKILGYWHVHPDGYRDDMVAHTRAYVQPDPSPYDLQNPFSGMNIVISANEKKVHFYGTQGLVGSAITLDQFRKASHPQ